jgi:hypothetical protein
MARTPFRVAFHPTPEDSPRPRARKIPHITRCEGRSADPHARGATGRSAGALVRLGVAGGLPRLGLPKVAGSEIGPQHAVFARHDFIDQIDIAAPGPDCAVTTRRHLTFKGTGTTGTGQFHPGRVPSGREGNGSGLPRFEMSPVKVERWGTSRTRRVPAGTVRRLTPAGQYGGPRLRLSAPTTREKSVAPRIA